MNIIQLTNAHAMVKAALESVTKRADSNPQAIAGLGAAVALIDLQLKLSRDLYNCKSENDLKTTINNFLTGVNNA